jgi:hypothetical protein
VVSFLFCKYKILDAYESPKYANRWAELFSNIYRNAGLSKIVLRYGALSQILKNMQDFLKYLHI